MGKITLLAQKIHYKTTKEQDKMRVAGQLAAKVLELIEPHVIAGVTTKELDTLCVGFMEDLDCVTACLNYRGFPESICTSINDVACHGIPDDTVLKDGDIINIDITVIKDGWHGDTSKMFCIGEVSEEAKKICDIAHGALWAGINAIKPYESLGIIGKAIEEYVSDKNVSIARNFSGHGIGLEFHEAPSVLSFEYTDFGVSLIPGLTFTIEPIINVGTGNTHVLEDNWTVKTDDGKLSAQWEHTILITEEGFEILTLREEENNS